MKATVLHVTTVHSPNDNRIFRKECAALSESGYKVALAAPSFEDFSDFGVESILLKPRLGRVRRMILGPIDVLRAVISASPNVVHAHDPELIPLLCLIKIVRPNLGIIYDAHEDLPKQVLSKPYLSTTARRILSVLTLGLVWLVSKFADRIVAATPSIACTFPEEKTTVVQNFPLLKDYPLSEDEPTHTAVYVGALSKIRGGEQLFQALDESAPGVSCAMAGPIQDSLVERADSCEKFTYLGIVEPKDVRSIIGRGRAGIVCFLPFPNHTDAQPNKLFEYMAAGRAIICSDFPLWRQLLEPFDCAYFVNPEDSTQLRDAIERVASHPAEADEMGKRARRAFESNFAFDSEKWALLEAYRSLL